MCLCDGIHCASNKKCWRYTYKSDSVWQGYFSPLAFEKYQKEKCEYFIPNDPENNQLRKD